MVGKERNFGLDIVRAISILLVVFQHHSHQTLEFGVLGVQIFFILSGFLIGQILINDFKNGGNVKSVIKFWKRRWYRTLPMYYLILTLKIVFFGNPLGLKILVYYFFLQANFVGIDFFSVSWSLIVEEWFYIFLPLFTLLFFHKGIHGKRFPLLVFLCITFFFCARFAWNYFQKGIIIYQFDCLLLGVLMAWIKLYHNRFYQKLNSPFIFLFALVIVISLVFVLGDFSYIPVYAAFYRVTWYFLVSFFIAFLIPYSELSTIFNDRIKKIRAFYYFFTWTSILTYSIYLIHADVYRFRILENNILDFMVQLVIIYILSFIFYALYEHPMMSLRDKFSWEQYKRTLSSFSFKI